MANNVANKTKNPVFTSQNKLKLATFSFNCSGGATMSKQPESITPTWAEQVAIAKAAEAAGIEAIIPVGRWKGMGGETNFQHSNFETLSWAAGLAAITEKVAVFSTVHVPTIHPVRLAKIVRRQNIWRNSRRRLAECGRRLGVDVRRRACGVASVDARWSAV